MKMDTAPSDAEDNIALNNGRESVKQRYQLPTIIRLGQSQTYGKSASSPVESLNIAAPS
jgi:hypothetical protein